MTTSSSRRKLYSRRRNCIPAPELPMRHSLGTSIGALGGVMVPRYGGAMSVFRQLENILMPSTRPDEGIGLPNSYQSQDWQSPRMEMDDHLSQALTISDSRSHCHFVTLSGLAAKSPLGLIWPGISDGKIHSFHDVRHPETAHNVSST